MRYWMHTRMAAQPLDPLPLRGCPPKGGLIGFIKVILRVYMRLLRPLVGLEGYKKNA